MSPYDFMDKNELREECRRLHAALFDSDMRLKQVRKWQHAEDGSAARYADKFRYRYGWWLVHNLVAHVLIGVAPVRLAFAFHDWTSRKMRGAP